MSGAACGSEAIKAHAKCILSAAETAREALLELCGRLIASPSVNPAGDTRGPAAIIAQALAEVGITASLERKHEIMPSVLARLDSGRPGPHLIFNCHLDTMPPGDESAWTVPIWEMTRRDGRIYGLGIGNMKGAAAAMVFAMSFLQDLRDHWCGKITFTAVSDEVVFGDGGAAHLLETFPDVYGDGMICGEGPGFKRLAIGEKGVLWLELSTTSTGGHSSAVRRGTSASAVMAAAITAVDSLTGMRGTVPPELLGHFDAATDPGFELTANVGLVQAGTFVGQVATTARAEVDLRVPPGLSIDDAQRLVENAVPTGVSVHRIKGWDPNWSDPASRLSGCWISAEDATTGKAPEYAVRLPASDGSRWRAKGVPVLCYGPQATLSAGIDEYAEEDEIVHCVAQYTLAALAFLTPEGAESAE